MKFPTYKHETKKYFDGIKYVAGCDEVGIAPLAGPVVSACVILDPESIGKQRSKTKWWYRVRDSKTTNEKEREELVSFIKDNCTSFAVGIVSRETIDEINIFHAANLSMKKAVDDMQLKPEFIFIDGIHKIRGVEVAQETIIGGDEKVLSIAAASIIAKVARDNLMKVLHATYPMYGFDKHKGYPTKFHREAISKFGITPEHRLSFSFVQQNIKKNLSAKHFQKALSLANI